MRKLTIVAVAFAIMACDASKPELEKQLAKTQQISAEKDSLLKDVMATSQFIAEVNAELAKVRRIDNSRPANMQPGEMESNATLSEKRARVVEQVRLITARVNASEARLAASRKRVAELAGQDSSMKSQLASYDSTITSFKSIVDNQKAEIASLTERVRALDADIEQLKSNNVQLVSEKTTLTDERDRLTTERNTVYYVIGDKETLLKKHIIEQTGGTLGLGKVKVPARMLNPADFTAIDKTKVMEIAFPNTTEPYRIITRQDLAALETPPAKGSRLTGSLKIKDADAFWSASKFLIIIQD
jgi:hypothetical protein